MPDGFSPGFIPSRHRPNAEMQRMLGVLHRIMPAAAEPDPARWQRMGEDFMVGDPPMDTLLDAMRAQGLREAKTQFERALHQGIAAVPDASDAMRAFFREVETLPAWVDRARLERGAELHRRAGVDALYVGRDVALVGGYQASAFNKTLILTGALQKGPTRRLAETLRWALDCTSPGGLAAFGVGYRSTLHVRLIHALVRRHVRELPDWRMEAWGLPINQPDMAATLLGALAVPLLGARLMGMPQTRAEREDANHLVRYVGWLMGVDPRWLAETHDEALKLLMQLLLSLANPDETSAQMAQPMVDEPLARPYPRWGALRGRVERSRHLSISRAFLGRRAMRQLGLPDQVLPWYPVLNFPRALARHVVSRVLPGGKARAAERGRTEQEAFLRLLCGERGPVIGESARVSG